MSQQGEPSPDGKDVVLVPPGQTKRIRMRFDEFTGKTVYHCHILDHEDLGMMATLQIIPSQPAQAGAASRLKSNSRRPVRFAGESQPAGKVWGGLQTEKQQPPPRSVLPASPSQPAKAGAASRLKGNSRRPGPFCRRVSRRRVLPALRWDMIPA